MGGWGLGNRNGKEAGDVARCCGRETGGSADFLRTFEYLKMALTAEPLLTCAMRSDWSVKCLFTRSIGEMRDSRSKNMCFGMRNIRRKVASSMFCSSFTTPPRFL